MSENKPFEDVTITNPFTSNPQYKDYLARLKELRADGEDKINALKNENREVKLNKVLEKEVKQSLIATNNEMISEAKTVRETNKAEVKNIIAEASKLAREEGKTYFNEVKEAADITYKEEKDVYLQKKEEARANYESDLAEIKQTYEEKLQELNSSETRDEAAIKKLKKNHLINIKTAKLSYKSKCEENKKYISECAQKRKDTKFAAFKEKDNFLTKIKNNHRDILGYFENKFRTYIFNFKVSQFLLKNALYIIIVLFFLATIVIGETQGKHLLTTNNILSILGQSSTKVFYSLGVAGLILLGGTDLSIGRLTGMGASFSNMILSTTVYTSTWGLVLGGYDWPLFAKVIVAILVSIIACTLFTSIAGFFTAKFKMHPFITTLSTQLLVFGLMMINYSQYPSFNMNLADKKLLTGDNYINIIIMAVVVIALVWFIWNKTKFGKNMYAVGGNMEAASVSGINVFWTTLAVFIMAGVLYGIGGYASAIQIGSANVNTGNGTELDAIAACVVGGISFSGGIGKISGAVIGTIVFTSLTYCLTFLGIDANAQFIFKGIIIMAAVCLDSIKYLKKK